MKKHMQDTAGALQRYRNDATIASNCRSVTALAFVPPNRRNESLQTLKSQLSQENEFLADWLEDYYVDK